MDTGRIDLAKFTRQEIRLLLIIPLYIDIVTRMQDRFCLLYTSDAADD